MNLSGIFKFLLQFKNISSIFLNFEKSHLEISGKDNNDEQKHKKPFIFKTSEIFHFEISGKDVNEEHPLNKLLI